MSHQLGRREFLRTTALGSLAAVLSGRAWAGQRGGDRPNILYIMADDHAAHAMSCYGSAINQTPNIDRIAGEGMRFDNCFCTNSICGPSRAVILTGKYSHLNGFPDNRSTFDGSQQTFPKLLQRVGYQTAMIGKWHLVSDPTGFDYWNVLPGQGAYHNPDFIEMGERKNFTGYATDLITDFSLDWLRSGRDPGRPFCLMCHHKAPHRRWEPDEKHAHMYDDVEIPIPPTLHDDWATRSAAAFEQEMTILRHLTEADIKGATPPEGLSDHDLREWKYQRYIKDYLRCIASVDDNVGRVLDYLDASGLADNTLIAYSSDQGFFLGDHGWFDKRFMYEEALRMPLVMRLPGTIEPGSVNNDLVQNLDFAPTFLDLAGVDAPEDMQGRALTPILEGDTPDDWRDAIYYHYTEYPAVHMAKRHYGVRTKRHKLIHFYYDVDAWELYDLEKDPEELRNAYDDPAYASVVAELKTELERLRIQYGDDPMKAVEGAPHPDFSIVRGAKVTDSALGYDIASDDQGYALREMPRTYTRRLTLRCKMRSLRREGTRNGLLCFGPTAKTEEMLKCGLYIGVGEGVVVYDHFAGSEDQVVRHPFVCDRAKTFDLRADADLKAKVVRVTIDGEVTFEAPIAKDWAAVRYVGYNVNSTETAFSAITVEGY